MFTKLLVSSSCEEILLETINIKDNLKPVVEASKVHSHKQQCCWQYCSRVVHFFQQENKVNDIDDLLVCIILIYSHGKPFI